MNVKKNFRRRSKLLKHNSTSLQTSMCCLWSNKTYKKKNDDLWGTDMVPVKNVTTLKSKSAIIVKELLWLAI